MSNFQKCNKIDVKKQFPIKKFVDSIKCITFAPTRTRQASSQCLNRRVVLFSYGTLFKNLHIARPVDGIAMGFPRGWESEPLWQ